MDLRSLGASVDVVVGSRLSGKDEVLELTGGSGGGGVTGLAGTGIVSGLMEKSRRQSGVVVSELGVTGLGRSGGRLSIDFLRCSRVRL